MFPRLLLGSLAARRSRVALALIAVALGAGMTIALATLALEVGDDVALALRAAGPNFLIEPRGADWGPDLGGAKVASGPAPSLPESTVALLKQSFWKNNILEAAPELELAARAGSERFPLIGAWFRHEVATEDGAWSTGLEALHPTWQVEGSWPRESGDQILLGRDLARRLAARAGTSLTLEVEGHGTRLEVAGILAAGGPEDARAYAPLALVQRLAGRPGAASRVWLSALLKAGRPPVAPDPMRDPKGYERYRCTAYPAVIASELSGQLPDAQVVPATERIQGESHVVSRLTLLMVLLALAGLAAATLGMLSTMTAAVVERTRELALMRAIGASSPQLAALLLGETLLVAAAGGTVGWALGSAGAALIRGASFAKSSAYQPLLLPVALAAALAVALLGTLGPLRVALRLDPARVLRG